eukprot:COSAG06_NODE_9818_length_1809_cov_2.678947_4_plen_63_part_00
MAGRVARGRVLSCVRAWAALCSAGADLRACLTFGHDVVIVLLAALVHVQRLGGLEHLLRQHQ